MNGEPAWPTGTLIRYESNAWGGLDILAVTPGHDALGIPIRRRYAAVRIVGEDASDPARRRWALDRMRRDLARVA